MGEQKTLGRLKLNIHGAAGSQEKLNSLVREMNRLYGGQDLEQASTKTGKLQIAIKRVTENAEAFGEIAVGAIIDFGDEVKKLVDDPLSYLSRKLDELRGIKILELPKMESAHGNRPDMISPHQQPKEVKELTQEELDALKKAQEEAKALRNEFYTAVKFMSDKSYAYQTQKIEEDKKAFIKAGITKVDAERWANDQLFELNQARFERMNELWLQSADIQAKGLMLIPHQMNALSETVIEKLSQAYQKLLEDAGDWTTQLERSRETLDGIADVGNELEQAFSRSGDTLLAKLNQALQIAVQIARSINTYNEKGDTGSILGMVASFIPGLGFLGSLFGLHKGGVVTNARGNVSYTPIPKFATGTDFIVPKGYYNDSFPMRVESGERVQVTPANQAGAFGISSNDITRVVNAIQAMNMNLIKKKMTVNVSSKVDGLKFYEDKIAPAQNRSNRSGKNVSGA